MIRKVTIAKRLPKLEIREDGPAVKSLRWEADGADGTEKDDFILVQKEKDGSYKVFYQQYNERLLSTTDGSINLYPYRTLGGKVAADARVVTEYAAEWLARFSPASEYRFDYRQGM